MKKSFAGVFTAAGLMLATAASAQETNELDVSADADKIEACFNSTAKPVIDDASVTPVSVSMHTENHTGDTDCGVRLHVRQTDKDSYYTMHGFASVTQPDKTQNKYSYFSDGKDIYTTVAQIGPMFIKTVDHDNGRKSEIEIIAPSKAFAAQDDMDALAEEQKAGIVVVHDDGNMIHLNVADDYAYNWVPETVSDNILLTLADSIIAIQRIDTSDIEAAVSAKSKQAAPSIGQP